MTTTPAQRVNDAFASLPTATREAIGTALRDEDDPFLAQLGYALGLRGVVSELTIDDALHKTRFDKRARTLADSFGDDEPWRTVADAIRDTLADDGPGMEIASDYK